MADLTDSGVSVVSDGPPKNHSYIDEKQRVMDWLKKLDKSGRGIGHTHSEMAVPHRSATSPNANRHRKGYGSRSSSLERNCSTKPAQPFVADPNMPPLPSPHTDTQLEEVNRRLGEFSKQR